MSKLLDTIESAWPPQSWIDVHVLVAVSGGPDSMALLQALWDFKRRFGGRGDLHAAHVNHSLHAAADDDEAWLVAQLDALGIPLTVHRAGAREAAAEQGDGLEAAARSVRYAALQATAEHLGARYVATGHNADDQVETVLHRILRGTGVEGLAGIPRQRPLGPATTLVRPLLDATRQHVLDYLAQIDQGYREDPTNAETTFTRNRIRSELLPQLKATYNTRIEEALLRLSRQAAETTRVLGGQVQELLRDSAEIESERIVVDAVRLREQPEPLVRELLRAAWRAAEWPQQAMTDAAWRKLAAMLQRDPQTPITLPGDIDARRENDRLVLRRAGYAGGNQT